VSAVDGQEEDEPEYRFMYFALPYHETCISAPPVVAFTVNAIVRFDSNRLVDMVFEGIVVEDVLFVVVVGTVVVDVGASTYLVEEYA
jgi:hypothetical protein